MYRFYAVHNSPVEGTHLHRVFTSHARTLGAALEQLRAYRAYRVPTAPHQRPILFFDRGEGSPEMWRLRDFTADLI